MSKINKNSGIPAIKQIINLLDFKKVNRTADKFNSDRYCKKFKTTFHLTTMLYSVLSGCNSLRQISGIMLGCQGRINHLGLDYFPKRSTLSDANKKRKSYVFGEIYYDLFRQYGSFLSDSRMNKKVITNLKIVDSTTISLFGNILQGVGRNPIDGKKKGGIKVHTVLDSDSDVPVMIRFSPSKTHDHTFLKELNLPSGSLVVFDKGYIDYKQYLDWNIKGVTFVTRQKDNALWWSKEEFEIPNDAPSGILKDERIGILKGNTPIDIRRIAYWDDKNGKLYEFITNNFDLSAEDVANIYKRRWQIEILFKCLKQNYQLKYFLGDNQNAIEIQIWATLIAYLLTKVIQKNIKEHNWAFANIVAIIRAHLMAYIDLFRFLNHPNAKWEFTKIKNQEQYALF